MIRCWITTLPFWQVVQWAAADGSARLQNWALHPAQACLCSLNNWVAASGGCAGGAVTCRAAWSHTSVHSLQPVQALLSAANRARRWSGEGTRLNTWAGHSFKQAMHQLHAAASSDTRHSGEAAGAALPTAPTPPEPPEPPAAVAWRRC